MFRYLALLSVTVILHSSALHADLILTISISPGSNSATYVAAGSYTVNNPTGALPGGSRMYLPGSTGAWFDNPDENVGEYLRSTGQSVTVGLSNGVTWFKNDVPFTGNNPANELRFGQSGSPGLDDVEIRPQPRQSINYPDFDGVDDVISWSGSGTFFLADNEFDDFIPGVYSNGIDYSGGQFIFVIQDTSAVPEPTSILLAGCAVTFVFCIRRRSSIATKRNTDRSA